MKTKLFQDLRENVIASGGQPNSYHDRLRTVVTLRFLAVVLFRIAQLTGRVSGVGAGLIKQVNQVITGADLAYQAEVSRGLVLFHPVGVVVGPYARLGTNCHLQQGVTIGGDGGPDMEASPSIGNRVHVGPGARILGRVAIGDDSRVGANAVVLRDVPDSHVAVGVPARATHRVKAARG